METLKLISELVLYGMKDCVCGLAAIKYFWSKKKYAAQDKSPQSKLTKDKESKTVLDVLMQCIVFGFLYWIAIRIFHRYVLYFSCNYLRSSVLSEEELSSSCLPGALSVLFDLGWTFPLFVISRILNYAWYQDIAELTYEDTGIKKRRIVSVSYSFGDQIASALVQIIFLLQGYMVFLFPMPAILKEIISIVHLSLLYSLYAFEYKWVQMGWSLTKRLTYLDSKWPYFMGFGLPLAVLSSYIGSYIESICIFSTLFPLYVISSTVTFNSKLQEFNHPLRSFRIVSAISDLIICNLCTFIHR